MTQTQFLLLLIAIIPFINCLIIKLCAESPKLVDISSKLLPTLFLANLIGLYGNLNRDNSYLVIAEATRGVALGFDVDALALGCLFLLTFFWIIFVFYSQRFFQISDAKNATNIKSFFAIIIAFLNLIIISKNLLSVLFFYNCLIILCHFFATKFLYKKQNSFTHFFTFLLYLESILLFLAIVATYKFTGQIDFVAEGIISDSLSDIQYSIILTLYLGGLFMAIFIPSYLLYRNFINLDPIIIYILFFLAYGLSTLYIFTKILAFTFGFKSFALMGENFLQIIEWIFLVNILATSIFLLFSKGLKSSFFYLFFQQFLFALFSIFIFAIYNKSAVCLALFSFLLSITLIFLTTSNFILYLSKSEHKWLGGLFYNLKITSVLFIFAIFNLIGLAPGIGAVEKFHLIKILFQKELIVPGIIFGINFISLLLFAWKVIYQLFLHDPEISAEEIKSAGEIAKAIDFDSSLILTALIVAVTIFLGLILFPLLTNLI
jgi:formate hydrogenlyase subunit 3/multisubunit Na+/H+ antiporter MnhD subunit